MIVVAQHERRAGDRQRLVNRSGKRHAGIDQVDRAEPQAFVDLVLIAELRRRKDLDLVAARRALLDLVGRPKRFGVIGLAQLRRRAPISTWSGQRPEPQGSPAPSRSDGAKRHPPVRKAHGHFLPSPARLRARRPRHRNPQNHRSGRGGTPAIIGSVVEDWACAR